MHCFALYKSSNVNYASYIAYHCSPFMYFGQCYLVFPYKLPVVKNWKKPWENCTNEIDHHRLYIRISTVTNFNISTKRHTVLPTVRQDWPVACMNLSQRRTRSPHNCALVLSARSLIACFKSNRCARHDNKPRRHRHVGQRCRISSR